MASITAYGYSSLLLAFWRLDAGAIAPKRLVVRLNGRPIPSPILCVPLQPQSPRDPGIMLVKAMKRPAGAVELRIEDEDGQVLARSAQDRLPPLKAADLAGLAVPVRNRVWAGLTGIYARALGTTQTAAQGVEIATALAESHAFGVALADGRVHVCVDNAWQGAAHAGKGEVLQCSGKTVVSLAKADVLLAGGRMHAVFAVDAALKDKDAVFWIGVDNGLSLPARIDLSKRKKAIPAALRDAAAAQPELAALLRRNGLA